MVAPNRSLEAVNWMKEDSTRTAADAARMFDLSKSTIMRALARRKGQEVCPHCGQIMRTGMPVKKNDETK